MVSGNIETENALHDPESCILVFFLFFSFTHLTCSVSMNALWSPVLEVHVLQNMVASYSAWPLAECADKSAQSVVSHPTCLVICLLKS